jgi:uncharacterized protein (UPF0276 family)
LTVPKLGIGLSYQPQLRAFIRDEADRFDYLEVVPDILWTDLGPGSSPRYVDDANGIAFLQSVRNTKTVVAHSIGLSIGSAHRFDSEHVAQMARWYDWFRFPWHSDHLAFHLAQGEGDDGDEDEINLNLTMPLVLDEETLRLVSQRVREVRRRIPVPFLLENNVYYFQVEGEDYTEARFLSELCNASGCGLLLDLHNLYTNCRNLGTDPYAYLVGMDLDKVMEIHVAGGMELRGFYIDAHSGASPGPVWELLDWTLPRCPNVGGITFELFGSWYEVMGEEGLKRQLARMRETWHLHQPPITVGAEPGAAATVGPRSKDEGS